MRVLTSLDISRRWATWQVAAWGSEVPQRGRCGSDWGNPRTRGEVSARPLGGGGWMVEKAERGGGDFERGSVVEVVVVKVVGGEEEEKALPRGGKGGKG